MTPATLLLLAGLIDPALAQRHPFAVGGAEGGGAGGGIGGVAGLILAWQTKFHAEFQAAARALRAVDGCLPASVASLRRRSMASLARGTAPASAAASSSGGLPPSSSIVGSCDRGGTTGVVAGSKWATCRTP